MEENLFRKIPKVDLFLKDEELVEALGDNPRTYLIDSVRKVLSGKRDEIRKGKVPDLSFDSLKREILEELRKRKSPNLKKVINATGVVLHTNLGRAPLPGKAIAHLEQISNGYSNLEYDVIKGKRGLRYRNVEDLLKRLTGAEDVCVVNNNAGAVLLILSALASGKEVIVSRGELIEIGGSFRIPDVMMQSGAILKEVGTTNKTHLFDYENAISESTGLLMRVHTSNYKILGFTEKPSLTEIVNLGKRYGIPVYEDLGSGSFIDVTKFGLSHEPTVQEVIKSGVDVVSFSGDKLLGSAQAGIILGKRELLRMIKKHPLNRALRVGKLTLSVLEATLRLYLDEDMAVREIPVLMLLSQSLETIKMKAEKLCSKLQEFSDIIEISMVEDESEVGGGALPLQKLPTYAVCLRHKLYDIGAFDCLLRNFEVPIVARIKNDRILLDMRTVFYEEVDLIYRLFKKHFS